MYDLSLTAEQLEFRDTLRDFVQSEVKPAAVHPDRLQPFDKPLMTDALGKAAHNLQALWVNIHQPEFGEREILHSG